MGIFNNSCLYADPEGKDAISCRLPDKFVANGGIAGVGVSAALVFVSWIMIIASFSKMVRKQQFYFVQEKAISRLERRRFARLVRFVDPFLVGLSNVKLVTSTALLITASSFLACSISAYHYDIVCYLALMSTAAYLASLLAIHGYYQTHPGLGLFRVVLAMPNFVLLYFVFLRRYKATIFPSGVPLNTRSNGTGLVLNSACFLEHPAFNHTGNMTDFTASVDWVPQENRTVKVNETYTYYVDLSTIYGNFDSNDDTKKTWDMVALILLTAIGVASLASSCILATYRQIFSSNKRQVRKRDSLHQTAYVVRFVGLLFCIGVSLYGLISWARLYNYMQNSVWLKDDDGERNIKTFGQLMPLILLALPGIAAVENYFQSKENAQMVRSQGEDYTYEFHDAKPRHNNT